MKNIKYMIIIALIASLTHAFISCKDDEIAKRPYRKVPKPEYTREAPDEWAGLEDSHLPIITILKDREPDIVVRVDLGNPNATHYIQRIGIMDDKSKDIVSRDFTTNEKVFEARFFSKSLPGDKKKLKVYAKCSLHDLWTEQLEKSE